MRQPPRRKPNETDILARIARVVEILLREYPTLPVEVAVQEAVRIVLATDE